MLCTEKQIKMYNRNTYAYTKHTMHHVDMKNERTMINCARNNIRGVTVFNINKNCNIKDTESFSLRTEINDKSL